MATTTFSYSPPNSATKSISGTPNDPNWPGVYMHYTGTVTARANYRVNYVLVNGASAIVAGTLHPTGEGGSVAVFYNQLTSSENISWQIFCDSLVRFNANVTDVEGSMSPQWFSPDTAQALSSNGFSRQDGYLFKGWATTAANANNGIVAYSDGASVTINAPTTLYAVWGRPFYVTYDSDGGSGTPVSASTNAGNQVVLASGYGLSRAGYQFRGWVLDNSATSSGITYPAGHVFDGDTLVTITSDVTATARWKGNESTVTLNSRGGTGGTPQVVAEFGTPMPDSVNGDSVIMPTRTGYTFGGYFTSANGGGTKYYNADGTSATDWDRSGNLTLYAYWIANSYVVRYSPNYPDAIVSPRDQTCSYGANYFTLGERAFLRDGYRLVRWNTKADDTGVRYQVESSFSDLSEEDGTTIVLYAIWARTLSVSVSAVGADAIGLLGNSPTVAASPSAVVVDDVVSLTAQTSGLVGIGFKRWAVAGQVVDETLATYGDFSFVVTSERDVEVTAIYERLEAEVSVVLSAPCSDVAALFVGASVRCTSTELGETAADMCRWGDTVWFKANDVTGYTFAGWWDVDTGERKSAEKTYGHVLSKAQTRMEARYSVEVSVSAQSSTEEVGGETVTYAGTVSAWVDSVAQDTSASFLVTIGSALRIAAEPAEGSYFHGWNANGSAVSLARDQPEIRPTEAVAYVATFGATPPTYFFGVQDVRNTTADGTTNTNTSSTAPIGTTELVGVEVVPLSTSEARSQLAEAGFSYVGGFRYYKVVGRGVAARLVVSPATGSGALQLLSVPQKIEIPPSSEGPELTGSTMPSAGTDFVYKEDFSTSEENGNILITSTWGTPVKCTVAVRSDAYGVALAYSGGSSSGESTIADLAVDASVTVVATPNTGYVFDGWFESGALVSALSSYTFAVRRDVSLEARFHADTSAIFVWEGGEDVKTMEWDGHVVAMQRPMDPVAARVDATGYPVNLTVGTYSSPSASPTAERTVVLGSQDGRRLQRMRPERFLRVSVSAQSEVDSIVVATNMAEVN